MNDHLKSKRNFILSVLILVFTVGLFGTYSVFSILRVIADVKAGIPVNKVLLFVPAIFLPFTIYTIYYLLFSFPQLKIDRTGISLVTILKTNNYQWKEVKYIELTGKQFHRFLFISMPVEATTIYLQDNSKIYLWVDHYSNKSELRVILERANSILQNNLQFSQLDFNTNKPDFSKHLFTDDDGKEFNGNHLLSLNGLIFYGWLGFFTVLFITRDNNPFSNLTGLIILPLLILSFPAISSYQMHYFIVGEKYLIIKNTIWFWKRDIYLLSDIKEVVIETPYRTSTSLRIITNDYRDKFYPAGSLRKKAWKNLMEQLLSDQIKVRNEAIF